MTTEENSMQFTLNYSGSSGVRLGKLALGTYCASTPSVLLTTSRLSVPHTTLDRLRKIILPMGLEKARAAGILAFADKLFENPKLVKNVEIPTIHKFAALQDFPVVLALESGLEPGVEKLNNGKDFVTVMNNSGACKVPIKDLAELSQRLYPDVVVIPHSRVSVSAPAKHLSKAAARTTEYIKLFQESCHSTTPVLEPSFAGQLKMDSFGKMLINSDESNIKEHISSLENNESLRYVPGMFNPVQVVQLLRSGVDLLDTSFVDFVTNQHQALLIDFSPEKFGEYQLVDLEKGEFFEELQVLSPDCRCLACADKVTKSYIHHLIKTHEMLATVHLQAHNLHQYIKLVEAIRDTD